MTPSERTSNAPAQKDDADSRRNEKVQSRPWKVRKADLEGTVFWPIDDDGRMKIDKRSLGMVTDKKQRERELMVSRVLQAELADFLVARWPRSASQESAKPTFQASGLAVLTHFRPASMATPPSRFLILIG
jgi:hypothetical protein